MGTDYPFTYFIVPEAVASKPRFSSVSIDIGLLDPLGVKW